MGGAQLKPMMFAMPSHAHLHALEGKNVKWPEISLPYISQTLLNSVGGHPRGGFVPLWLEFILVPLATPIRQWHCTVLTVSCLDCELSGRLFVHCLPQ